MYDLSVDISGTKLKINKLIFVVFIPVKIKNKRCLVMGSYKDVQSEKLKRAEY